MHRRGFRLPIAQVQGSVQLGALHPRGRAGDARDASQRDPGVRLGHVRLPPGTSRARSSRASAPRSARCFFFRRFSRTARPLVVASVCPLKNVENGFRNAIVGRVGARPRALDRGRRSIAVGRSRACRPDRPESRLPASRARAPPPPPPRDADRGGVFRRDSTPRGNNTHLRFDEIARSRERKKKKQPLTISRLPAARSSPHAAPTATARLDSSRFSRRFTSPRLGATTAGGTS